MRHIHIVMVSTATLGVVILAGCKPNQISTVPQPTAPTTSSAAAMTVKPSDGWSLHIDARKHFSNDFEKDQIAHHYCKAVAGGLTECQLYDGDGKDARLVGVETIISAEMYKSLPENEKKFWHYHKDEIAKVDAKLPDLSSEEAAKVVEGIQETYGKIFILWNPAQSTLPVGEPHVTIID